MRPKWDAQGRPKGAQMPSQMAKSLITSHKNTRRNRRPENCSNKCRPGTAQTSKYRFSLESEWHPAKSQKPQKKDEKSPESLLKRHPKGAPWPQKALRRRSDSAGPHPDPRARDCRSQHTPVPRPPGIQLYIDIYRELISNCAEYRIYVYIWVPFISNCAHN